MILLPRIHNVERFTGICGSKDCLEAMPDGDYLQPFEMSCLEKEIQKNISGTTGQIYCNCLPLMEKMVCENKDILLPQKK